MKYKRFITGAILIVLLTLLMLYSSLEHNKYDPNIQYKLANFEKYNNTMVSFTGEITEINENNHSFTVRLIEPPYLMMGVEAKNTEGNLNKGDIVEILGILDGENHVTAEKLLLFERWKFDLIYIRSLPAIPFALYIFFKTWKFNWKTYRFERRTKDA